MHYSVLISSKTNVCEVCITVASTCCCYILKHFTAIIPTRRIFACLFCVCVCVKVGLAVGDTADERDKAMFTRTRLQVEFILELEATSSFLRGT